MALCYYEVGEFQLALEVLEPTENNNLSRLKVEEPISVPEIDDIMSVCYYLFIYFLFQRRGINIYILVIIWFLIVV